MFSFILTLASALIISVIGAYFSIIGLSTIFPGSQASVIIMGCALEVAKIVTVLWLHRNWGTAKWSLKFYFCFAVFVLMGITSLGIFGFLSKAHVEHQNAALVEITQIQNLESRVNKEKAFIGQYESYIESLEDNSNDTDEKSSKEIDREQKRLESIASKLKDDIDIEANRITELSKRKMVLDEELLDLEKSSGGLFSSKKKKLEELKNKQAEERGYIKNKTIEYNTNIENFRRIYNEEYSKINNFIQEFREKDSNKFEKSQEKIEEYNSKIKQSMESIQEMEIEKSKYGEKIRNLEAEIGPLKYVVGLIKDFGGRELNSDQAVRLIILIIMVVFDPLAILLIVAAQTTYYSSKSTINKTYRKLKEKVDSSENQVGVGSSIDKQEQVAVIEPHYEDDLDDSDELENIIESEAQTSNENLPTPSRERVLKDLGNTSDNHRPI